MTPNNNYSTIYKVPTGYLDTGVLNILSFYLKTRLWGGFNYALFSDGETGFRNQSVYNEACGKPVLSILSNVMLPTQEALLVLNLWPTWIWLGSQTLSYQGLGMHERNAHILTNKNWPLKYVTQAAAGMRQPCLPKEQTPHVKWELR